jgi:hypothetical protein
MDEIASLRRQLRKLQQNLLTIEEQEAGFIDPRSAPPDWSNAKQVTLSRISDIKARLSELETRPQVESILVPFVVVAMNVQQASDLINGEVLQSGEVTESEYLSFQEISGHFREDEIGRWISHYAEEPDNWRPHTHPESTIQEIVADVTATLNQTPSHLDSMALPFVTLQSYTAQFFAEDEDIQEIAWRELASSGCILIVDAVSLFHPTVNRAFSDSQLASKDKVAVLILSPINPCDSAVHQLLEKEIRIRSRLAFARFHRNLDRMCEIGVGDLRALKRWLFAVLPEAAQTIHEPRANPSRMEQLMQMRGEQPQGIQRAFYGQGGTR